MLGPYPKRCLREQDKWSDLFNPFFARCDDFWKEFEKDPHLLEAYEICHRLTDTWTPHTIDHAATYYQRKFGNLGRDGERSMMFPGAPRTMFDPAGQQRRSSLGDLNGGNFIAEQNQQRQHQFSAEQFMIKNRARRHSTSESTATVIMKRNLKDYTGIDYGQLYEDSPTEKASRKLAKVVNGGISESRGLVLAIRGRPSKHDGGSGSSSYHVDEMDFEPPANCNRKPAHLDSPVLMETTRFPIDTNFALTASSGRRLYPTAESSRESTPRPSRPAPPAKAIPPTKRYNESLLNNTTCSPRLWKILHGKPSEDDDKENDAE